MKKIVYIIISVVFISCTKDINLPLEKYDQALVVNCLFSEDSDWKVILSRVKSSKVSADTYVDNAWVGIVPEGQDTIWLTNEGGGVYQAKNRPVKGVKYQLVVKDQGKIIQAKSAIPSPVKLSSVQVSGEPSVFYFTNLLDYDVVPVKLSITPTDKRNYLRLRFYSLDTYYITRFVVSSNTIETLRAKHYPENFLSDLSALIGKQIKLNDVYDEVYDGIMSKYRMNYDQYQHDVFPAIEKIKIDSREETDFHRWEIFSGSSWLTNISFDRYNVLGQIDQPKEADLFVSYSPVIDKKGNSFYNEEYWLEAVTMSEAYYNYQKSYINQATNIKNPFSSAIEVYSNIEGGVGIFAGYSKEMIHFHDY